MYYQTDRTFKYFASTLVIGFHAGGARFEISAVFFQKIICSQEWPLKHYFSDFWKLASKLGCAAFCTNAHYHARVNMVFINSSQMVVLPRQIQGGQFAPYKNVKKYRWGMLKCYLWWYRYLTRIPSSKSSSTLIVVLFFARRLALMAAIFSTDIASLRDLQQERAKYTVTFLKEMRFLCEISEEKEKRVHNPEAETVS